MNKEDKPKQFTHIDKKGDPAMVDVSDKAVSRRTATARAIVEVGAEIMDLIRDGEIRTKKGAVIQTAILAGVMAAKKTGELIPLCHPLGLDNCRISIQPINDTTLQINCSAAVAAKTGVEMEALTGASVAALTIYDMCKAHSHDILIREVGLIEKTGGKKDFKRKM